MADTANITGLPGASTIIPHPREQLRQMRAQVAAAAQRLIDLLDEIDGDPDFEPSLGSVGASNPHWMAPAPWAQGANDDREEVSEDEGAQCDDEGVDSDSEPNADDQDNTWEVAAFAMDQTGTQWAGGEGSDRPRPPEQPTRTEQRLLGTLRGPDGQTYQALALTVVAAE